MKISEMFQHILLDDEKFSSNISQNQVFISSE